MLNQLVLVGRLTKDPELKELESGKRVANISLAVPRPFKNAEGVYETDFINATIWGEVANNTCEYAKKGDVIGVKGRLESDIYEKDGKNITKLNVVAERITFLSSKDQYKENKEVEGR